MKLNVKCTSAVSLCDRLLGVSTERPVWVEPNGPPEGGVRLTVVAKGSFDHPEMEIRLGEGRRLPAIDLPKRGPNQRQGFVVARQAM